MIDAFESVRGCWAGDERFSLFSVREALSALQREGYKLCSLGDLIALSERTEEEKDRLRKERDFAEYENFVELFYTLKRFQQVMPLMQELESICLRRYGEGVCTSSIGKLLGDIARFNGLSLASVSALSVEAALELDKLSGGAKTPNEERNEYIYRRYAIDGLDAVALLVELKEIYRERRWGLLTTPQAINQSLVAYCKLRGIPKPKRRGRR